MCKVNENEPVRGTHFNMDGFERRHIFTEAKDNTEITPLLIWAGA